MFAGILTCVTAPGLSLSSSVPFVAIALSSSASVFYKLFVASTLNSVNADCISLSFMRMSLAKVYKNLPEVTIYCPYCSPLIREANYLVKEKD